MQILDGRESFYQWDINQKITSPKFIVGEQIHFYNLKQNEALVVKTYILNGKVVANVPNILLQNTYPIKAYHYIADNDAQFTIEESNFKVVQRAKPDDYVYTETEVLNYAALDKRIAKLEDMSTNIDYVFPEDYGAVGNGTDDDTAALQSAIDVAHNIGKEVVLSGKYKITSSLQIYDCAIIRGLTGNSLYGCDSSACYIKSEITDGSPLFVPATDSIAVFDNLSFYNVSLSGKNEQNVFDIPIRDSRFYGGAIYHCGQFAPSLYACNFIDVQYRRGYGNFCEEFVDGVFSNCYFSGVRKDHNGNVSDSGTPSKDTVFARGTMNAIRFDNCYFDFWGTLFECIGGDSNNHCIINSCIIDCIHTVFWGSYMKFAVTNCKFLRIHNSDLWNLGTTDWTVFNNGLCEGTIVTGNHISCDVYIAQNELLDGSNNPVFVSNAGAVSANNYFYPEYYVWENNEIKETIPLAHSIDWNVEAREGYTLENTKIEELNYKEYAELPTASLTSGSGERCNHMIAHLTDGSVWFNSDGTWVRIDYQKQIDNINNSIGDIDTALDSILAIQQSYIGGDAV